MRVAQKFLSYMTTQTLDGRVYEIDTRLRPSGEAGLLVTSLKPLSSISLKMHGFGNIKRWFVHARLPVSLNYAKSLRRFAVRF